VGWEGDGIEGRKLMGKGIRLAVVVLVGKDMMGRYMESGIGIEIGSWKSPGVA
jgi:hypothetical protein